MILADPRNPTAERFRVELASRLPDFGGDDLGIVIGGDGFMLHTVAKHGLDRTYLGLNAGRIGFLMNDVTDWDQVAERLQARAYTAYEFPVLRATLQLEDGTSKVVHAVNDVALERSTGQTAHLTISIDDTEVVGPLVADGIIFSTALGSTAYTFSAGGPACHPTLPVLAVTAIAAHHPRLSPFMLPETSTAEVRVEDAFRRPVRAVADGTTIDSVLGMTLEIGPKRVRVAWFDGHDFTKRMVTKILRP